MRRARAEQRAIAAADRPAAPDMPDALVDWIGALTVTQGQHTGDPFTVLPWQRDYLVDVEASAGGELALSVAAGAGKTTLLGAIAAAGVAGPLAAPRAGVILVAGNFSQACIAFDAARAFLAPIIAADPERWRVVRSEQAAVIEDRATGAELRAREANAKTLHGAAPVLIVADEPAQWKRTQRDAIYSALRSRLGKIPGARLLAIGTAPSEPGHWFGRMLTRSGRIYAAPADCDPFDPAAWYAANPSLAHLPALLAVYEREAAEAARDASLLPEFRALRLNMGTADTEVATLLEAGTWEAAECDLQPAAAGGYVLGVDLGGAAAMSAAAGYWYRTGRLDAFAYFAEEPDLEERGRRDAVGTLYADMHGRGELLQAPGRVVDPGAMIGAAVERWGRPVAVVGDRYRQNELLQAMTDAGLRVPVVFRGQGYRDGAEDVRRFQRATIAGKVRPPRSLLLRYAIGEARTIADPAGNRKLAKHGDGSTRRALARDDAAAAAIVAVAEGARRAEQPAKRPRRHYIA